MNLLAFDTSTETMSIALARTDHGQTQLWQHTGAGGAQASVALIPAVLDLLRQARLSLQDLQAICFGCGPGAFTGLRTACAVAQGLGFGAGRRLLPVNSLLAVAEEARFTHFASMASVQVMAMLDARMQQIYAAGFAWDGYRWQQTQASALLSPEALQPNDPRAVLAGNVFALYGTRLQAGGPRYAATPTAAAMLRLAPALLAAGGAVAPEDALPLYIRDDVAQTTAQRAAAKAAAPSS